MKFTLLTFFISVVSLAAVAFSHVIPLDAKLSTNPVTVREPTSENAAHLSQLYVNFVSSGQTPEGNFTLDARGNDCGSSPFQNPKCGTGSNLKIGSGKVILGALVVIVAGVL